MKNLSDLAKEICKREGKKKQVNIAQVKEILAVLSDIVFEQLLPENGSVPALSILDTNGEKRAKARARRKK